MDKSERARLKQLANDAIIDLFGADSRELRLAQALEVCVDELEDTNDKCSTCSACEDHGSGEGVMVNGDEVIDLHRTLTGIVSKLKDSTVAGLAENLAALEDGLDDLERLAIR